MAVGTPVLRLLAVLAEQLFPGVADRFGDTGVEVEQLPLPARTDSVLSPGRAVLRHAFSTPCLREPPSGPRGLTLNVSAGHGHRSIRLPGASDVGGQQHRLVRVAPGPDLTGLVGADQGVAGGSPVRGRVAVLRVVAATHMAA